MLEKAVFLDRDGVINIDHGYVHQQEDFQFVDGIFDLCRHFQELGYLLIVVTNQSGIARGMYSEKQFQDLTNWMIDEFRTEGIHITKVYHCPHHPEFGQEQDRSCECRKPKPGMIQRAIAELGIDPVESILIGDKVSDMEAGIAAGIGGLYLLGGDLMEEGRVNFARDFLDITAHLKTSS